MKRILEYFFSILLCLCTLTLSFSQEEPEKQRVSGLRIGYDLSRLALYYFEPERTAYEISADFEIRKNLYPVFEFGQQKIKLEEPGFNYLSDGYYFRLGIDYNFQKNYTIDQYEMVFIGFRYGFSKQTHSANNITVEDQYWGGFVAEPILEIPFQGHWIELAGGIRAELFKNFFIGWSFRGRLLLVKSKNTAMEAYYIPGYGKATKRLSVGINYSIYYKIPMFKFKSY